uniref:Uncharacterized protein n=1 Tax=Arundo donax TaxID=35708 RepID=A0A0A9DMS1_ARUDO
MRMSVSWSVQLPLR